MPNIRYGIIVIGTRKYLHFPQTYYTLSRYYYLLCMNLPNRIPFASRLIVEVAPEIGASVWLEPEYGFV